MCLALVGVETGGKVELVAAEVALERPVPLQVAALVLALHVARKAEDGGQHHPAQLTLEEDGRLADLPNDLHRIAGSRHLVLAFFVIVLLLLLKVG